MENWKKRQKDSRSPRRFARFESVVFRASVLECGCLLCRFHLGTHWRVLGLCVRKSGRRTAAVQDASRGSGAWYFIICLSATWLAIPAPGSCRQSDHPG